jgi:glycosyltransferase involved in cell wall biosynthesis
VNSSAAKPALDARPTPDFSGSVQLLFITGTPATVREGSGTWTGISTLAAALRALGHGVALRALDPGPGDYGARRAAFNASLESLDLSPFDTVVGFDMDGHALAGRGGPTHVASIKGVIADEALFEEGETRRSMEAQAGLEAVHCRRADRVVTTSAYSAKRLKELYGLKREPAIVPELIDLKRWQARLSEASAEKRPGFTVLCVCRMYRRKRVDVLLRAAAALRGRIAGLRLRIVGDGPEHEAHRALARSLKLEGSVDWLGYVPPENLAAEYKSCDLFCLPSVQEGFGIVLLEAMAAGAPIVAARAAAIPEVASSARLVKPDDVRSLADALHHLASKPDIRRQIGEAGRAAVARYDAPGVAELFLQAISTKVSAH